MLLGIDTTLKVNRNHLCPVAAVGYEISRPLCMTRSLQHSSAGTRGVTSEPSHKAWPRTRTPPSSKCAGGVRY
jgi:hypothetical protein